jgi:hypothetical protein
MTRISVLFASFVLVVIAGCGPSPAELKGSVKYGGKAVRFGEIVVYGSDGLPRTAKISREGEYEIKDLVSGDAKVAVSSIHPKDVPPATHDEKVVVDPIDEKNWFEIHRSYADPLTSGQTTKLGAGKNVVNFDLVPKN